MPRRLACLTIAPFLAWTRRLAFSCLVYATCLGLIRRLELPMHLAFISLALLGALLCPDSSPSLAPCVTKALRFAHSHRPSLAPRLEQAPRLPQLPRLYQAHRLAHAPSLDTAPRPGTSTHPGSSTRPGASPRTGASPRLGALPCPGTLP
jgi:hypothetical protein